MSSANVHFSQTSLSISKGDLARGRIPDIHTNQGFQEKYFFKPSNRFSSWASTFRYAERSFNGAWTEK